MKFKTILNIIKRSITVIIVFITAVSVYCKDSPLTDSYFIGGVPCSAAIGRGGAYTGVASSPFASYWNPAALSSIKTNQIGISMSAFSESDLDSSILKRFNYLGERSVDFFAVCAPEIGAYWRPLSNKTVKTTWIESKVRYEETIDEKINVYGITVAVAQSERTDFGMNINLLSGVIGYSLIRNDAPELDISYGHGWGLDWGLIYKMSETMNAGLTLINGPAEIHWDDFDKNRLPLIFRGGIDIRLTDLMSMGMDYDNGSYDDSVSDKDVFHIGIEQYIRPNIILRGGAFGNNLNEIYDTTYTAGIGYNKKGYKLDIAARQFYIRRSDSGMVRKFSVSGEIAF
ncbi:hypothetical protein ACFLUV_05455 [Elusimicrobiota bacterium]